MRKASDVRRIAQLGILVSSVGAASCGGAAGRAVAPTERSAAGALGDQSMLQGCSQSPRYARPLVVDLPPDARVDLEAAMKKGLVTVAYDCRTVRVVSGCTLTDTSYEYAGVSRKEQVVQIKDLDEMNVNLPLLSAKIGTEVKSGRSIDLALVLVGRRSTTVSVLERAGLEGDCGPATHFVQVATLGAFSVATGSVGKVGAVGDLFGVGASAQSSSERRSVSTDGSLASCRTSDPDAPNPPSECRAPLRLELQPITGQLAAAGAKSTTNAKPGRKTTVVPDENPCPEGYDAVDGLCTRRQDATRMCKKNDEAGCKVGCEARNTESCNRYGDILKRNAERAAGPNRMGLEGWAAAKAAYKAACEGDSAEGCIAYGMAISPDPDRPNIAGQAKEYLKANTKACTLGSGYGCLFAGDAVEDPANKIVDARLAAHFYERGCSLGNGPACSSRARMSLKGEGVPQDSKKGVAFLTKSCRTGTEDGADQCGQLGELYAKGESGVTKDLELAYKWTQAACRQSAAYCLDASASAAAIGKDGPAFAHARVGCDATYEEACTRLGDLYNDGKGVARNPAKARETWTKACNGGEGDAKACKRLKR